MGDNCKLAVIHKDESTDHIHVIISTEETKTQRFKNRYGEGEKKSYFFKCKKDLIEHI